MKDRKLQLHMYLPTNEEYLITETSLSRELIHTMEHATVHMAIIHIAFHSLNYPVQDLPVLA